MKEFFFLLFCFCIWPISALVIKNNTCQTIKIISFADAQGWEFHYIPDELRPQQIIEIPNVSYNLGQEKPACLEHLTVVTQIDLKKQAFIVTASAKDLGRMYSDVMGLSFGIPKTRKLLRKYYEAQERFPGQLNIRTQNVSAMKKC